MRHFAFFLTFLLTVQLTAQIDLEALDRECQLALDSFDVPGFAIGIVKDGKVILAKGYGVLKSGEEQAVDANTIFAIASNTKAFTASALAKLSAGGAMSLDDPVRKYLPAFSLYDPYVSEHIQVRDLLCHRAGLGTFSGDVTWFKSQKPAKEIIKQIRHLPQAYEFRGGYGYTNLMFITAGEVIGAVSGKTWQDYFQQEIFRPLGMNRTYTSVDDLTRLDNVASPHITRNNNEAIPYVNWDNMGAAGGILSSVNDMLAWVQMQLNDGQHNGRTVFSTEVMKQTWKPHNIFGEGNNFISYGLGYFTYRLKDNQVLTHGGGYDGMYSRVTMVPAQNLGIVVLTNSMTGLSSRLGNRVLRTYLDIDDAEWLADGAAAERRSTNSWNNRRQERINARIKNTQPIHAMTDLVGDYHDPLYGDILIKENGGQLELHFDQAPGLEASLSHWHYDTYQINWKESNAWFDFGTLRFVSDNNGNITGLRFDVPNDDIFFHEIKPVRKD